MTQNNLCVTDNMVTKALEIIWYAFKFVYTIQGRMLSTAFYASQKTGSLHAIFEREIHDNDHVFF